MQTFTGFEFLLVRGEELAITVKISTALERGGGCQITGTIGDDGEWVDGPSCISNGCDSECHLKSEEDGGKIRYWCECS